MRGLNYLPETIEAVYSLARIQLRIVHMLRIILNC
jgi:transposase-like protein